MGMQDESPWQQFLNCRRLGELISTWPAEFEMDEFDQIRALFCPVDDRDYGEKVLVSASDAEVDGWRRATTTVVERVRAAEIALAEARQRLTRPEQGAQRVGWSLRYLGREDRAATRLQQVVDRLRDEVRDAYRTFEYEISELTRRIEDSENLRREQEERRERDRFEARQAAMVAARKGHPVWRYRVRQDTVALASGPQERMFLDVCLDPLDRWRRSEDTDVTGLTHTEVHLAIAKLRAKDPYLIVLFQLETGAALREWSSSEDTATAWQRLTGVEIELWPLTPEERRKSGRSSSYGPPITDYGTPSV